MSSLNPDSVTIYPDAMVEPSVKGANGLETFQSAISFDELDDISVEAAVRLEDERLHAVPFVAPCGTRRHWMNRRRATKGRRKKFPCHPLVLR